MGGVGITDSVSDLIKVLVTFSNSRPLHVGDGDVCEALPHQMCRLCTGTSSEQLNMKIDDSCGWEAWWATLKGCGALHKLNAPEGCGKPHTGLLWQDGNLQEEE